MFGKILKIVRAISYAIVGAHCRKNLSFLRFKLSCMREKLCMDTVKKIKKIYNERFFSRRLERT